MIAKSQSVLDRGVILQFSTIEVDKQNAAIQLEKSVLQSDILEARVIELKKKKDDEASANIITIGRASNSDVVLYNKAVSKSHACLYFPTEDGIPYLVDVGSVNATYLNDQQLIPCKMYQINDGDEISFGPKITVIYLSAASFYDFLLAITVSYAT